MTERNRFEPEKTNTIVDLDEIPCNPWEDADPCDVFIIADDMLASPDGETVIRLRPDALALNGLLRTRDRWASGPEVRDAANLTVGASTFGYRIRLLQEDLQRVAGVEEPIEARGDRITKAYRLSPRLLFHDKRSEDSLLFKQSGIVGECVALDEYDETNEEHRLHFDSVDNRRSFLAKLFKQYATLPEVRKLSQGLVLSHSGRDSRAAQLAPDDVLSQLLTIERGVVAFAQSTQTPETEKAGADAVIAYHTLLLSSVQSLRSLVRIYGKIAHGQLNDELFQQGCEVVIKIIMDAGTDIHRYSEYFYNKCMSSATYAMIELLDTRRQKRQQISPKEFRVWRAANGVYDTLAQKLQREPSPAEIAAEIDIEGLSQERVEEAVYRLMSDRGSVSMDAFEEGGEFLLIKHRYYEDEIDQQIEAAHFKDLTDMVFMSSELDDREKIALSLLYEVYRSDLASAVFNSRLREPFEYPLDAETFERLVCQIGGKAARLSEVVKLNQTSIGKVLQRAYAKARVVLQDEV